VDTIISNNVPILQIETLEGVKKAGKPVSGYPASGTSRMTGQSEREYP